MLESLSIQLRGLIKPRLSVLGASYSPRQWYRNRNADLFVVWFPKTGGTWARLLLNTAIALQATGQDAEARRVLDRTRQILDEQARAGANNSGFWASQSEYAALTGDVESMLEYLTADQ